MSEWVDGMNEHDQLRALVVENERLREALRDVSLIAECASVDDPVWLMPNKIKARVHSALGDTT